MYVCMYVYIICTFKMAIMLRNSCFDRIIHIIIFFKFPIWKFRFRKIWKHRCPLEIEKKSICVFFKTYRVCWKFENFRDILIIISITKMKKILILIININSTLHIFKNKILLHYTSIILYICIYKCVIYNN